MQIKHDPTFLGYLLAKPEIPEIPLTALTVIPILIATLFAVLFQIKNRLQGSVREL